MRVKTPAVLSINLKSEFGAVTQMRAEVSTVECEIIPYSVDKLKGHLLRGLDGREIAYLLPSKPKPSATPPSLPILIAEFDDTHSSEVDLSTGYWWQPDENAVSTNALKTAASVARESWRQAFEFTLEDPDHEIVGLRKPQLGALHAIHAHWSTSRETATVVMPTGTGKTETMLSVLVSLVCQRILVVVPSDALRTQIADKFATLGFLKFPGNKILSESAERPVVGKLTHGPKSVEDVDAFFVGCNVVVTTSQLLGGLPESVQEHIAELCSHLFIDEAHHSEAPTWQKFRSRFNEKLILQFTATPFREDGNRIDGKLIYIYPLKQAQADGYFRPIKFLGINEFNAKKADEKIAAAALTALDEDSSRKHIVMARVDSRSRAESIYQLYQSKGRYAPVIIHSGMKPAEVKSAKSKLLDGSSRIVVCVDMLGEGFDLPELKIAAFHDIRKSLSVTLQLAGRFTRARKDLGDPLVITNIALVEVREELRLLYTQDPDWNILLPEMSKAAIDDEVISQQFFTGFERFIDEVPLKDLRPAASMVVYKTDCVSWRPTDFRKGFRGLTPRDKLYHSLNKDENTLVILAAREGTVKWSDVESIRQMTWELFIAIWDSSRELLYIHGSGNDGEYKDLAKALCGTVQLAVAPQVFRAFHGVNRLVMNNVGLEEHLGRQVRFTARMGSDVESRITTSARQGSKRSVLSGTGYRDGGRVTVGAAKRGRVWSNLRLRIDSFSTWARELGKKIDDEKIDPDVVLAGTLRPEQIGTTPALTAIAVEWPRVIYERQETTVVFGGNKIGDVSSTYVDIDVAPRAEAEPILVRIFTESWESLYRLEFLGTEGQFDFKFSFAGGQKIHVTLGEKDAVLLDEFLTEHPPVIWFSDGSSLEGTEFTQLPASSLLPYHTDQLDTLDWTGVDIKVESQGESKKTNSIQYKVISLLKDDPSYRVIFDDDGAGECADVVGIRVKEETSRTYIEVELYHLKYSKEKPGARVDDLYVVCGQAQRSVTWLASHQRRVELFTHLLKRDDLRVDSGRASRFERGSAETLLEIRTMSRRLDVRMKVFVVQPGLSKSQAGENQLRLLAVTERYLSDTYGVPLSVICSE